MIVDISTPSMHLPAAPQQSARSRWAKHFSIRWPLFRSSAPDAAKKGFVSVAIVCVTAAIVLMRAPGILRAQAAEIAQASVTLPPGTEALSTAPAASTNASAECSNQVWPYIAANCLQGQTRLGAARMAVATQPDARQELQNEDQVSSSILKPERLSRDERRVRRAEQRRARYEERRARQDEWRARRYDFSF